MEVWSLVLQDSSVLQVSPTLQDSSALQEDVDLPSLVPSDPCLLSLGVVGSIFSSL